MKREKYAARPLSAAPGEPFASAAEAWFWGVACLVARAEGARVVADRGAVARPCDPVDLVAGVERLARAGRLGAGHVRALFRYGRRAAPPDPRDGTEAPAARLWDEALDRLGAVWRRQGILA
jgi:hypothetical protein